MGILPIGGRGWGVGDVDAQVQLACVPAVVQHLSAIQPGGGEGMLSKGVGAYGDTHPWGTQCYRDIFRGQRTQSGSGSECCSHEMLQGGHGAGMGQGKGMGWRMGQDGTGDWGGMRIGVGQGRGWDAAGNGARMWHGMEIRQGSTVMGMGWHSINLVLYNLNHMNKCPERL